MKFATQKSDGWQVTGGRRITAAGAGRSCRVSRVTCHASAFTLAEVLAAMLFLAIVIPAALEALHVAGLAGEVAARKGAAVRLADRLLNESIVTTNWNSGSQGGTANEGAQEFRWTLNNQNWPADTKAGMRLLTANVNFSAQGHDYSVELSTLANSPTSMSVTGPQP
jgi:hypothetical protein